MCVCYNNSSHLLDDRMLTAGCYRHHARGTYDVDGRYGLARYLQKLLESKSSLFCMFSLCKSTSLPTFKKTFLTLVMLL